MKLIPSAHELISEMRNLFLSSHQNVSYGNEEPLRAELYSSEQMERFGRTLAASHTLSKQPARDHLLKRLADNESVLHNVRKFVTESIKLKHQITPAAEWLIDNFYLVEEHIRIAKKHFPKGYSEDLPQLSDESSVAVTRIYDIVLQIISHSDGRIDIESLSGFISSYQSETHLQLGELWAIPIMLRLALIENLRRVSTRIAIDRADRNLADYWAKQMSETADKDPKNLIIVIADMARSNPPMVSAFVSEFSRQLRGKGPDLAMGLNWIERQLSENGLTSEELVNAENQKQAADQVSMSNSIGSLRLLGAMDWRDFVEMHSVVDQTLRTDAGQVYAFMDFATRDKYRHVVEHIARGSTFSEEEVAAIAIRLADENTIKNPSDQHASHVGYYLIDKGVIHTKRLANHKESLSKKTGNYIKRHAFFLYLFSIAFITLGLSAYVLIQSQSTFTAEWMCIVVVLLSIFSTSQLAISIVNFISTLLVDPQFLPRMDFSRRIPMRCRTLVAIPAMLVSEEEIENLIEGLEVRFLANRNENLHFGLVTDFTDAAHEALPGDQLLIECVHQKIIELNLKYGKENESLFFLFHRQRSWNPREKVWMGYERKRGKLSELNTLLRGESEGKFSVVVGDESIFPQIKYVITLDVDTQLPLGSAWKLIGTMAHPLNHAIYDVRRKRITDGYGILQPRVSVSLPDITSSLYTRMHGNEPGIDPYTRASSDVYQDLFGEGSFIGKGIYDVDIFRKVLDGKFSENGILSHDLIEGCYVRSGLLSDVQLFEKYPSDYRSDRKRASRWIRGDWQIFAWFLPFVPGPGGKWTRNPISGLSRWKIFDNIRRSLIPVALTCWFILGWTVLPFPLYWTTLVSIIVAFPVILTSLWDILNKPHDVILKQHIINAINNTKEVSMKTLFAVICLPYEAFANSVAIVRTLWRMLISRRHLLEWNPSGAPEHKKKNTLWKSYLNMWSEPVLAIGIFIFLGYTSTWKMGVASPFLLLWVLTPFTTWWMSRSVAEKIALLNPEQTNFLRKTARRTYGYFEQFVSETDNWLPPDNFQEQPIEQIAHRTSPTNIGLALLSNLAACDFGYITSSQLLSKSGQTIGAMKRMDRYRGHFYNWYDTETLEPLLPRYISTVDSGNLAGHLLILKQGLLAIPSQQISKSKLFEGLRDTLRIVCDSLEEKNKFILKQLVIEVEVGCRKDMVHQVDFSSLITKLHSSCAFINEQLVLPEGSDAAWWKDRFMQQVNYLLEYFTLFEPWELMRNAPLAFEELKKFEEGTSLNELSKSLNEMQLLITGYKQNVQTETAAEWLLLFATSVERTLHFISEEILTSNRLAGECDELADMEWDYLFDNTCNLFTIGYNVQDHRVDSSYYDLLASEARFCIFIGIAQGKLPEESWFALGRLLTKSDGDPILLSWSGSMFEYLMPLLVMPNYQNTLLDQTCKAAVEWQISYGKKKGTPWGISESGFNMINANSQYQYRAFGVPGLGLKRGLEEDTVIAPYASVMALMINPVKACKNLLRLEEKGMKGRYGFYEAIDYTPARMQRGQNGAIVYSFMAHHEGMSLLSLAYLLLDKPMQKLFEAEPQFKAAILLLQERIPKATAYFAHTTHISDINYESGGAEARVITTANTPLPEIQLLSNGRYHVMITNSGAGYSTWKDLAVTRWREDATCDNWGVFCYIRDLKSGKYWSAMHQPTLKKGDKYEAVFSQGRADFNTTHNEIETHSEIVVSPEDDIEMRRFRILNNSSVRRTIELTSYAEVVLAPPASDKMQPAFSNLFVQTEIIPLQHAIICTRRPRSVEEIPPWMFHLFSIQGKLPEEISFETDRMEFIGRGNSIVNPKVMNTPGPLLGNQGSVLDPIVAIRYKITLEPEETIVMDMVTGISDSRDACEHLISKYQDKHHKDRVFELAWTHSQVVLRQINATESEAQMYGRLASSIVFTNAAFRADPSVLISNKRGQSGLWGYSISGDLPIVLLKIEKEANMQLVKQLVQAHSYWRLKGLSVDLVIWNEEHNGYRQIIQNEIEALIPWEFKDRPGGVFVRASDQISNEDRILFQTVARVIISDNGNSFADLIRRKQLPRVVIPYFTPLIPYKASISSVTLPADLLFFNGIGGFSPDGSEYLLSVDAQSKTPAPWVNVIANPMFGTVISESGSAYTWIENAHELRLTTWRNDPVCDPGGEAFYLRDEESGHFWSAALLPTGGQSAYITRHGLGYSVFEHIEDGIHSEMTVYVDLHDAVKYTVVKVRNESGRPRKISATGYVEWVLDSIRSKTLMHIHTEIDPDSGALLAKNPYNTEFSERVAFFDVDYVRKSFTGDRTDFIGRNGTLKSPDAMHRQKLSGRIGLAMDPCGAIQVPFELSEGEEQEIIFRLGCAQNASDASALARKSRGSAVAEAALISVKKFWKEEVGALQVQTPDPAINLLTNGWLTYQTISSRLWGRSGFYQSGGAYGFRDQIQDVISLLHVAPHLAREQILLCAAHQFVEGDVQHWWHPPAGNGVRTRCSDDYLWLPYATAFYIAHTADTGVLNVPVTFIEGRLVGAEEESYYDRPVRTSRVAPLYEHCQLALRHSWKYGVHGLPFIGTGDWNDGFDKVGKEGKGESVWMAFFLYDVLQRFSKVALQQGDTAFADECTMHAVQLKINIDKNAWDGSWYKRAWFDDGTPLGSSVNKECRIDSISQSWSVISEAGEPGRSLAAMQSAYAKLVKKDIGIIQLLHPAFDTSDLNPGYIKGYVPGVRENGGQYTHAAIWMIMAFAKLGNNERVWELMQLINPINHSNNPEKMKVYKVEPYVIAADVYSRPPHAGRGGWTWYTGSAGWMYRLITESFLGLQLEGTKLTISPCVPKEWEGFALNYRYKTATYHIKVSFNNREEHSYLLVDSIKTENNWFNLLDDANQHQVEVVIRKTD